MQAPASAIVPSPGMLRPPAYLRSRFTCLWCPGGRVSIPRLLTLVRSLDDHRPIAPTPQTLTSDPSTAQVVLGTVSPEVVSYLYPLGISLTSGTSVITLLLDEHVSGECKVVCPCSVDSYVFAKSTPSRTHTHTFRPPPTPKSLDGDCFLLLPCQLPPLSLSLSGLLNQPPSVLCCPLCVRGAMLGVHLGHASSQCLCADLQCECDSSNPLGCCLVKCIPLGIDWGLDCRHHSLLHSTVSYRL